MILTYLLVVLTATISLGVVLRFFRKEWASNYLLLIAVIITFPIVVLWKILSVVLVLLDFLSFLARTLSRVVSKAVFFGIVGLVLGGIIGFTYVVPPVGRIVKKVYTRVKYSLDPSDLISECRYTRQMLVEIKAEEDDHTLEYEDEDRYREEIVNEKEREKSILSLGESVLSLFIGGGLLISQYHGYRLYQPVRSGFSASILIQIGLLVVAISIIYRVSILDFLAYSGDEEFGSIEEMDVALSYQKMISQTGFGQFLLSMMVLAMTLVRVERDTVRRVLAFHYRDDTTFIEMLGFAWRQLRE